ncbi:MULTISPECIES: hypothetical protein [Bacillus subtilis group]|uniref:hypothetical protein n=1 Tax=Bacillus subtilis group TaxID=653685 RepID=UPI001CB96D35|nr:MULTISPECIES: hypothetical protein [Bacillus subtilis group]MEC1751674.1 hypothetical protein [Bacillus mojavensis]
MKSRVALVFKESGITCPPEKCAIAFITLFDGLNIQLVYENKQLFERSLEISFDILARAEGENLKNTKGEQPLVFFNAIDRVH